MMTINTPPTNAARTVAMVLAFFVSMTFVDGKTISGKVTNASGKAMEGVMVSAFDAARKQSTSVFSQADGSFTIDGLRAVKFNVRARLLGQLDVWKKDVAAGADTVIVRFASFEPERQLDMFLEKVAPVYA